MTLYVIFPIHLNFPIKSKSVFKAKKKKKKQWIVLLLLENKSIYQWWFVYVVYVMPWNSPPPPPQKWHFPVIYGLYQKILFVNNGGDLW